MLSCDEEESLQEIIKRALCTLKRFKKEKQTLNVRDRDRSPLALANTTC